MNLNEQIEKINYIISRVNKIPFNFDINQIEKIDEHNINIISNYNNTLSNLINDIEECNTVDEILLIINKNLSKYNNINNINNKSTNTIINYLLIYIITINISKNIINKKIKLEDIKNINKKVLINVEDLKLEDAIIEFKDDKIMFMKRFYIEMINKDNKIINYKILNKDNEIIKIIELNTNLRKLIVDNKEYEI